MERMVYDNKCELLDFNGYNRMESWLIKKKKDVIHTSTAPLGLGLVLEWDESLMACTSQVLLCPPTLTVPLLLLLLASLTFLP